MDLSHSYSKKIYNKKIAIFGPTAPPFGGISVHIKRITKVYTDQNNNVEIFNVFKDKKNKSLFSYAVFVLKKIYKFRPNIIDYHTSDIPWAISEISLLIFLKFFLKFKIRLIDHNPRYLYKKSRLFCKIFNILNRFIDKQVLIGDSTYQEYIDNKIYIKNISIESPFLPPDLAQEREIILRYPKNIINFLDIKKPIILFNAFQFSLIDDKDLYGFDQSINLILNLKREFSDIGLLMLCAQVGNQHYYEKTLQTIEHNNLQNNILIYFSSLELWPILKKVDLFIRPTLSDSFGISVQEAIYFNIPAVASNVCSRPKRTILYQNFDQLCEKTFEILRAKYEYNYSSDNMHEKQIK